MDVGTSDDGRIHATVVLDGEAIGGLMVPNKEHFEWMRARVEREPNDE